MCVYAHISSKFVTHIDIGFRKEELISSQVFTRPPEVPVVVVETTVWILSDTIIGRMAIKGGWKLGRYLGGSTGPRYYRPTSDTFPELRF
jgi:hypothetical protein